MKYDSFSYITPPRTEVVIPQPFLKYLQNKGWWAQIKKNGTNSVIFVPPDRKPFAYNRHGEAHKQWAFTPESAALFRDIPGNSWWVFNAELLHSKVAGGMKDTNYVHDVLVANGEYLLGKSYVERYELLKSTLLGAAVNLKAQAKECTGYLQLTPKTLLASIYATNFTCLFDSLSGAENEGLVLKNPAAPLGTNDGRKALWMAKIRRPNKNLGF